MIAIVCGGRDYTDAARVAQVLDAAVSRLGLACIIEGGAPGTDTLARQWALQRGDVSVIECPADWEGWRRRGNQRAAGPIRNALMLDILCGGEPGTKRAVIAFPGGDGTANMLGLARSPKAGAAEVRVIEV